MASTEPVTVINVFSVAPEHAEDFLQMWTRSLAVLRAAPGFLDAHLHRSLDPAARFGFVNVAHWDTETHWHAAVSQPDFVALTHTVHYTQHPASYRITAGWPPHHPPDSEPEVLSR